MSGPDPGWATSRPRDCHSYVPISFDHPPVVGTSHDVSKGALGGPERADARADLPAEEPQFPEDARDGRVAKAVGHDRHGPSLAGARERLDEQHAADLRILGGRHFDEREDASVVFQAENQVPYELTA